MSEKPAEATQMDDLSRLQKKVEELGVKFYECLGVLQRDAPPISRAPDEKEELTNDEAARKRLALQIPEFATDIVRCSCDIDALVNVIEGKMKQQEGQERSLLDTANYESNQSGEEMVEAADDAQKLLTSVRNLIAARERES